jgi:hypothetical protein
MRQFWGPHSGEIKDSEPWSFKWRNSYYSKQPNRQKKKPIYLLDKKKTRSFETSQKSHPKMQCHIPEDRNSACLSQIEEPLRLLHNS